VVRTSVFFERTLPNHRLTCDRFVGELSSMGKPTRPTQPSVPLGLANEYLHGVQRWKSTAD